MQHCTCYLSLFLSLFLGKNRKCVRAGKTFSLSLSLISLYLRKHVTHFSVPELALKMKSLKDGMRKTLFLFFSILSPSLLASPSTPSTRPSWTLLKMPSPTLFPAETAPSTSGKQPTTTSTPTTTSLFSHSSLLNVTGGWRSRERKPNRKTIFASKYYKLECKSSVPS